jgi:hypothetical protein
LQQASFAGLPEEAASMPIPTEVAFKNPMGSKLIGDTGFLSTKLNALFGKI